MVIYMYIVQGQGQTTPWEHFFVKNINFYQIGHLLQVFPINDFIKLFPIQTHIRPNLTLQ